MPLWSGVLKAYAERLFGFVGEEVEGAEPCECCGVWLTRRVKR